ncbi:hypothetical protein GCM10010275_58570 [Streptomyces litmocidini]|nr:hypothetical protein GCM10010275_58570 [Streptomyces litmocidini]
MAIPTVDASISEPMIRMIGDGVMKKKTTEEPMPSIGRSCINADSCCPRGSSGGGSRTSSSPGTSGGRDLGGRLTTIWLTGASIPRWRRARGGSIRTPPLSAAERADFPHGTAILLAAPTGRPR